MTIEARRKCINRIADALGQWSHLTTDPAGLALIEGISKICLAAELGLIAEAALSEKGSK